MMACISSSYSAYFFFPVVRLVTISAKEAASAPVRPLTPPPPGTGSLDAVSRVNSSIVLLNMVNSLEQASDNAVFIDIDLFGCRYLRQSRHGHDVAGQCNDESGSGRYLQISDGNAEVARCAKRVWIVCE